MIVLRVDVAGHSADVRWAGAEAVLGSGPAASIQRDDAGWAPREVVLVHVGRQVLVVRGDGGGEKRLEVGDSMRVGRATITLMGLLEAAADDEPVPSPPAPSGWEPTFEGDSVPAAAAVIAPPPPPLPRAAAARPAPPQPAPAQAPPPPAPASTPAPATAAAHAAKDASARWGHVGTFEDELVGALKRAPWYALSAAIHATLFALLLLFGPSEPAKLAPPPQGLVTASAFDAADLGGPRDPGDPMKPPEESAAPDIGPPEPPNDPLETVPDDQRRSVPMPAPDRPADPDAALLEVPQPIIGLQSDDLTSPTKRRRAVEAPAPPPSAEDGVNEDSGRALEVNRKAAARVRDAAVRGGGTVGQMLKGLRREDLLVIKGTFDQMETTLEELQVPYTLVRPFDVIDGYDFSRHKIVFWNCSENVFPPRTRAPLAAAVREFVRGGGYLFTTDWGVGNVIASAFPGTLDTSGAVRPLPELILDVQPAKAAREHVLLDGVFPEGSRVKWWLESASQDVLVARGGDVDVLIESKTLAAPPLSRSPVIAATFTAGRGRVLHLMGHFYQQKGNLSGAMGAQRLALNFIHLRLTRDTTPASR